MSRTLNIADAIWEAGRLELRARHIQQYLRDLSQVSAKDWGPGYPVTELVIAFQQAEDALRALGPVRRHLARVAGMRP